MQEQLILLVIFFIISLASVMLIVKRNFVKGIVGKNINIKGDPLVAESCGIALLLPVWLLVIYCILFLNMGLELLLVGIAISVFGFIGFLDDNKNKFFGRAVGWKVRATPIALISLIVAIIFFFPQDIIGVVWIILLALFLAGVASFSNTFEGLNGWTVGTSFIICIFASIVAMQFNSHASFLFLSLAGIILGLLVFNKYPVKAFPGDSGTLLIGSAIAGMALFTQNILFVIFVFLLFIPHMVDFFLLKMITNRDDATQQKQRPYKLLSNGKLTIPDYKGKTKFDFAKLMMKLFGDRFEWQIVSIIWIIVIINSLFWTAIFVSFVF